jgi:hypothetical protein
LCSPGRSSFRRDAAHLLACPANRRYSGVWWRRDESVSEGAAAHLRDLTFGSANSLGVSSVFRSLWTGTRGCAPRAALPLSALLAQRLRAFLSAHPSAEPLLLGGLPHRSAALATSAGQPYLAGQRGRQGSPAGAMPAFAATAAAGRSARTAARVATVGRARSACPWAPSGGVRGPAPSNISARFLGALLSAARLLHLLRRVLGLVTPAFLLWLVPPGVAACPRSRSPLPAAATPGLSSPATTADDDRVARFVMSLALVCCDRRAYFPWTPSRVGNGWVRVRSAPRCRSCGCRG